MYTKRINAKLIQGSRPNYRILKKEKKDGLTSVMDIGYSRLRDKPFQARERLYCLLLGLDYKQRPASLVGTFPSIDFFKNIATEVDKNTGSTLIHCRSGLHRTNLAVQAIEILSNKKNIDEAIDEIKKMGYFTFKKNLLFKFKKAFGLITEEKVQNNLVKRLDSFKKMFEQAQV